MQKLLAYRDEVPRPVMIEYLKTILGLHLGLYTLRLGRQLPGWIADKQAHPACRKCPVYGHAESPFAECPYGVSLTVDMGDDYRSRMAQLAQQSAASEFERLQELVRSIFAMNQLLRYAREERLPDDLWKSLASLPTRPRCLSPISRRSLEAAGSAQLG